MTHPYREPPPVPPKPPWWQRLLCSLGIHDHEVVGPEQIPFLTAAVFALVRCRRCGVTKEKCVYYVEPTVKLPWDQTIENQIAEQQKLVHKLSKEIVEGSHLSVETTHTFSFTREHVAQKTTHTCSCGAPLSNPQAKCPREGRHL